jgi:hypothetical protein
MESENLNFLEPSGPPQACNGTALPTKIAMDLQPETPEKAQNRNMENGRMIIDKLQLLFRVSTVGLKGRHILQDIVVEGFIRVVDVCPWA